MRFQSLFVLIPLLGSTPLTSASPTDMGASSSSPLLESRQSGTCECPEADGQFPNPCRCTQYMQRTNNIPIIGVCNFGQKYDSELGLCATERIAKCAAEQDCCSSGSDAV